MGDKPIVGASPAEVQAKMFETARLEGQHGIVLDVMLHQNGTICVKSGAFDLLVCPDTASQLGILLINQAAAGRKLLAEIQREAEQVAPCPRCGSKFLQFRNMGDASKPREVHQFHCESRQAADATWFSESKRCRDIQEGNP